jgi:hypothetical protein
MATFTAIGRLLIQSVIQYKGYKIDGESILMYMSVCESLGTVYLDGRLGSIFEVARIKGKIFDTIEEAEAHGLELAREWVDNLMKSSFSS